jgi:hypothetical protein
MSLLPVVLLAGCVTGGALQSSRPTAPGEATLSITRSDDLMYSGAPVTVELNGAKIASIGRGETYTGGIAPGPAVVSVSAWSSPGASHQRFTAVPGKTYRFMVTPRGENFTASLVGGVVGAAVEGGGAFDIKPVN